MTNAELKKEYNRLLERFWNGMAYLNNPNTPEEKKDKWLPEFEKIGEQLNIILLILKERGIDCSKTEILEGFGKEKKYA